MAAQGLTLDNMTSKKTYQAPSVEKLGTLAQITSATPNKGAADGGTGKNNKT